MSTTAEEQAAPLYELTLKQCRSLLSRATRREYGITVAAFEEWYPYRDTRQAWIAACQDAVETMRVALRPTVMDALVREIGEAKVLYVFRGPRMAVWPKGYMLPTVRRQALVKLHQPRRRGAADSRSSAGQPPATTAGRGEQPMTWRKHRTHREETAAVKAALRAAGIPFRGVSHGRGTAWGWLDIDLGPGTSATVARLALQLAQQTTGRHGDHDGAILVLTQ